MIRSIMLVVSILITSTIGAFAADNGYSYEFSDRDGQRMVRTTTPGDALADGTRARKLPIRNPNILAQVLWVDRNHENAIAENVAISPEGSRIFAGWWLNHERFSAYSSVGMESPNWTYREVNDWQMPVDASDFSFGGTGSGLPGYIWNQESPLYNQRIVYDNSYNGRGVSFSGDGNLVAFTSAMGSTDAVLIVYDLAADDTVFIRNFTPTSGQYGVDLSDDGSTLVVSNYGNIQIYNVPDGELIGTLSNSSQNTAKVSGDGSRVFLGKFNGSVYLYEWDGSQYGLLWSHNSGHDWITSVAISSDGSTAACGTVDFENGQIVGGKFMLFDVASDSVLIDYDEYGDYVGSVALSADGQYAVAGSWGQYGFTYGDVLTCFIRQSDIPIFSLRDDIDESGSIFCVDISADGGFAAAGGKAVHAREMGNGGMVYSIMIRDPLTNDVAVASIDEPGEFINPGDQVIPTATYINVGTASASFTTRCLITEIDSGEEVYNSTYDISNLGSFANSIVYFSPNFSIPSAGRYRMTFTAEMSGDEDTSNNDLGLIIRSWHDLQAMSVSSPFSEVTVNWPLTAVSTIRNFGSYYETADIRLDIYDSSDDLVFSTTSTVFDLAPYASEDVNFEPWAPDEVGEYRIEVTALDEDDYTPENNTITTTFQTVEEMLYDDGMVDISIWVDSYPNSSNRKFAQRFEPNRQAPFSISNVRVFLGPAQYQGYLDYVGVARELNNFPDTLDYISTIENPALAGPGAWSSFDMEGYTDDNRPLWVVLHWPDRPETGPYIGADNTGVVDQQSFWYSDALGWNRYLFYDWMIRMTLQEPTGTEFEYVTGLPKSISLDQNYPNPFNPSTKIEFSLPNPASTKLEVFSLLGRRVRLLADSYFEAGRHSIVWDGKDDSGAEAASGIYYYRLTTGDHRVSRKMVLAR